MAAMTLRSELCAAQPPSLCPSQALLKSPPSMETLWEVLESLPISIGGASAIVNFQTPPNTSPYVAVDFITLCPNGYVVPDKYNKRTILISGSGRAISCRPHMITNG